jgi:hypothetical protein
MPRIPTKPELGKTTDTFVHAATEAPTEREIGPISPNRGLLNCGATVQQASNTMCQLSLYGERMSRAADGTQPPPARGTKYFGTPIRTVEMAPG